MQRSVIGLALACALLVCSPALHSQAAAAMPAMEGMRMIPPPEQLPVPVRMTGIGNSHITIKASPEAQAWFDQGLSLLHDFWDYESAKAFEQAIRTDPNCAMCYWGLARAVGFRGQPDKVYGEKALEQAVKLKAKASKSDRLYIEAAEAESREQADRNSSDRGKKSSHDQSIAIYRKLVKQNPGDPEARIFLANAVGDGFDDKGEPKEGEKEHIAILESVLKDHPNDSAANHYWIHAMEPSNHPERAIPSAARLAGLAPTSGHMVHMPGHIYYRVGDYSSADRWFAASTAADEHYLHEQHVSVDDDWNYVHNMMYGIANLMEQGRLEDANALSDRLAGAHGELSSSLYIWSARDQMSRVSLRLPVAMRIADWNAVLAMVDDAKLADNKKTTNLRFLKDELRSFAEGMQALQKNDLAAAQTASEEMDAGLWRQAQDAAAEKAEKDKAKSDSQGDSQGDSKTADAGKKTASEKPATAKKDTASEKKDTPQLPLNPDAEPDPLVKSLSIASLELRAGILLLQQKNDAAKKLYDQAIAAEKKLGYREPPFYIRPVAETEAEALLRAKDYSGAADAYRKALIERPNSGFELYGIARADELAGNTTQAHTEYEAFLKAWPSADPKLPEILHAREAVGQAGTVAAK